jgi:hypothetical protein
MMLWHILSPSHFNSHFSFQHGAAKINSLNLDVVCVRMHGRNCECRHFTALLERLLKRGRGSRYNKSMMYNLDYWEFVFAHLLVPLTTTESIYRGGWLTISTLLSQQISDLYRQISSRLYKSLCKNHKSMSKITKKSREPHQAATRERIWSHKPCDFSCEKHGLHDRGA